MLGFHAISEQAISSVAAASGGIAGGPPGSSIFPNPGVPAPRTHQNSFAMGTALVLHTGAAVATVAKNVLWYAVPALLFSQAALAQVPVNRLALTSSSAADPFAQKAWPNPVVAPRAQVGFVQRGIAQDLELNPFAQHSWQNPQVPRRADPSFLFDPVPLPATVGDPLRQTDWPLPKRAAGVPGFTQDGVREAAAPPASPFSQLNWPNPRPALRGVGESYSTPLPLYPAPPAEVLARSVVRYSVPGPRVAQQTQQPQFAHLIDPVAPVVTPFSQQSWPNPLVRTRATEGIARGPAEISEALFAFAVHDTGNNPRLAPRAQQTTLFGSFQGMLGFGTPPEPLILRQQSWPNPRVAPRAIESITWLQSPAVPVGPTPEMRQYDWPVPRAAARTITSLTWLQTPVEIVPAPEPEPPVVAQGGGGGRKLRPQDRYKSPMVLRDERLLRLALKEDEEILMAILAAVRGIE